MPVEPPIDEDEGEDDEIGGGGAPAVLDESSPLTRKLSQQALGRLLLTLLLRIMPKQSLRKELETHGLKAEKKTPDQVIRSPAMLQLATRPKEVPFANGSTHTGYKGPRSSLRVSR